MIDHDDVRFASFTRDLARRHRRPRSYPPPPALPADALEQLCGGVVPVRAATFSRWSDELSELEIDDLDAVRNGGLSLGDTINEVVLESHCAGPPK
jgi:hypothetical protein